MQNRFDRQFHKYFILGGSLVALLFGGLIIWSVAAPFEGAVIASGTITVESRHQAVQHLEGGIVEQVFVNDGDLVGEGHVLIRLEGISINSGLSALEARLADLFAQEARLVSELTGSEMRPRPGADLLDQKDTLIRALELQAAILSARAKSRDTRIAILTRKAEQLAFRREGLRNEIASKKEQGFIVEEELSALQGLFERGLTSKTRILTLQRELLATRGAEEALQAEIAQTEVQIGEAELEITHLTDGFKEEVSEQLSGVVNEINELMEERLALLDQQSRLEIRSPRKGRVLGIKAHTVGGVIGPGDPIMSIVPEDDRLVAMIRILPQDIDQVFDGQVARLRFSAFNQRQSPEAVGKVISISADATRDSVSGVLFYEGMVMFENKVPAQDEFVLLPGMPVEVMLKTETRNVLSYLAKPAADAMSRTFRE